MGTVHFAGPGIASRSCIFVRSTIYAFPLLELCTSDVMTVNMTHIGERSWKECTCTSVPAIWFNPPLLKELWDIVGYCSRNTMLLITWYDAIAHHILWVSWTSIHKENVQWNLISIKHNNFKAHLLWLCKRFSFSDCFYIRSNLHIVTFLGLFSRVV
jgi:hypothetical protein